MRRNRPQQSKTLFFNFISNFNHEKAIRKGTSRSIRCISGGGNVDERVSDE